MDSIAPPQIDLTDESPPLIPNNNTPPQQQNPQIGERIKDEEVKVPKEISTVWRSYTTTKGEDGVMIAQCKGCKNKYKCGGKRYGTSSILRHREKCPKLRFGNVGQMIVDHDGKVRSRKINQKVSRDLLAAAVVKHDLPFSFVEYDGIRNWVKYLNPDALCVSRNTIVSDIARIYVREKEKLKNILANIPNRVCLTSDVWTACTSEGYVCLTCHFVDSDWKLNSKILSFAHMPPPHSGVELAAKLFEFFKEWGIEKKIFSLTLDNASNNGSMQDILKQQLSLQGDLLCDGEFFWIRCCAHILNLIVQEGLKMIGVSLDKIRNSIKYVKGSESRMRKFNECVKAVGIVDTKIGLRLDVATRWNSTFFMLESAIKYKKAFSSLLLSDKNYNYCPSNEEWKRAEKICEFLEPFYETTNLISGSSYPTSNLYFLQVWKIETLLLDNMFNEDEVVGEMSRKMKGKFDKYWGEYSVVLAFGAVLDPRIKLSMLEYFYAKVEFDTNKCKEKVSLVRNKLYKLFENYADARNSTPSSSQSFVAPLSTTQSDQGVKSKGKKIFDEIKAFESQRVSNAGKSQLDLYLEEPKLDFSHYEDLDVLTYWRDNRNRYPVLALLACDVLAIPITTVASESAFSIGGRVLTKYRTSTLSGNVQAQVCTRNWLHGYVDGNGEDAKEVSTKSCEALDVVKTNEEDVELMDEKQDNVEDFDDDMAEEN